MNRICWQSLFATFLATTTGCLASPRLLNPGTESQQQARSQLFEPYPEPDTAPEIVGARPHEYQDPRAQVIRVQPRIGEPLLVPNQAAPAYAPAYPQGVCPPTTDTPPITIQPGVPAQ